MFSKISINQSINQSELILSSCPETVTSCTTGPGVSDHYHLVIVHANVRAKQNTKKSRIIHLFRNVDWENVKSFLRSTETKFFQTSHETSSVNTNWQFFRDTITQAIEKFVPKKKVSGQFSLPWLTRPVKLLIRRKQRANNRAKKSNKDQDWEIFRKLRNKSQSFLKQAHWDYLNSLFQEDDSNNKRLWRYLKWTRKDSCGVSTLAADGKIGTDPCTKAEMLNHQFSSVYTRENQTNVPIMNPSPYPEMPAIIIIIIILFVQ